MSLPGGPGRGRRPDPNGRPAVSAGRGAVLVGIAVLAGILIFATIDDGGPATSTPVVTEAPATTPTVPPTNPDGTPATAAPETTGTTKAKKTTTTKADTKGARPNDQVVVLVLNGSGISGAAGTRTNELKAKGYQTLPAGNAPAQRNGSAVQCKDGYEKEAQVLVNTLGELGTTATIEPVPNPLPAGFDPTANCYVLLGK
jgi:hypothetical protein